jgi:hypothetical protein
MLGGLWAWFWRSPIWMPILCSSEELRKVQEFWVIWEHFRANGTEMKVFRREENFIPNIKVKSVGISFLLRSLSWLTQSCKAVPGE